MNQSEELDVQFSPSRWSRRYRAEEIVQKHVEFVTKVSNAAKNRVPCQLDVPYGPSEREKLDIFGTNLPDDSPVLIYIHGEGCGQELSREISSYIVEPLYKYEFKVIIIGYTLSPQASITQAIDQIQRAFLKCMEYVRNSNSRSLYLCGHSSGAHLAASLFQSFFDTLSLEDQTVLKAVLLISGLYDLKPLLKTYLNETLKLDSTTAKKLSPLLQNFLAPKTTIFFFIVGENDTPAYIQQSESFYKKLKSLGYKSELIVIKEVDHYDIVEHMNEDNYEIIRIIINLEWEDY